MNSEKVKHHLEASVKAWHNWNGDLPSRVEAICDEIKKKRGQFLNVRRWLIVPSESAFKECLVAEINDEFRIHINHLIPAEKELANWIYYEEGNIYYCFGCVEKRLDEINTNKDYAEECGYFQDYADEENEVECCKCGKPLFSTGVDC